MFQNGEFITKWLKVEPKHWILAYLLLNNQIQSPLVIVDTLIVDSLVIVDRLSRPNVYFSMYFSRNSGFSRYSGQFAADGRIHYYERRLYSLYILPPLKDLIFFVWYTVASRNSGFIRRRQIVHYNKKIHYYKRNTC